MSIDVEQWRGVAPESDERTAAEAPDEKATIRLRASTRTLLASLLREHRRVLVVIFALLMVQNAAAMAGPYLVSLGIDQGIAPLRHGDWSVIVGIALAFSVASIIEFASKRGFLILSGRVGQAVLYDLRRRVYAHFQRLSVGFHERYTSGRMVARLTSDMDTISEMVDGGLEDLVLAALSAGQRQLVAFARAFLADPAVLILDEATSSLDIPSERLVQRALRTILAERTAIVIAHRLSTVEIADRVLVIDGGRVVEDGSPTRLVAGGGRYAALHQQWRDSLI